MFRPTPFCRVVTRDTPTCAPSNPTRSAAKPSPDGVRGVCQRFLPLPSCQSAVADSPERARRGNLIKQT